jgi:hypothetical protein
VITALEATDWEGASGRIQFYIDPEEIAQVRGSLNPYVGPHDSKYGPGFVYPVQVEFVEGCKKEVIWPEQRKTADYRLPPWM